MKPRRFSVIDIGTNSARFLAAELSPEGAWKPIADRREPCRLGEGLTAGGSLGEVPMSRAIAAVAAFVAAAEEHRAPIARAVATHAVRKAANREEFLARLKERTRVRLEAIAPREEGRLSYRAVAEAVGAGAQEGKPQRIGVIDTGGGSVQLTVGVGDVPVASVSMALGAVAMTEMFGGLAASDENRFEDFRDHLAKTVEDAIDKLPFLPRTLYGVGGGCTSAGLLVRQRAAGVLVPGGQQIPMPTSGEMSVTSAEVRELLRVIRPLSAAERAALPSLSVERSQIIVAGLAVIEGLLSRLSPHNLCTLEVGLRDGLVIETAETVRLRSSARAQSQRSILPAASGRLGERCRVPQPHTSHVAGLALRLHSELSRLASAGEVKKGRWCRPRGVAILHGAALVHDAGIVVSYKGHHKHSEAIVRMNGLCGVKPGITDMVAAIARYHRRARPSKKHELFESLDRKNRRKVRMLAGILRVADGLDRSHAQLVKGLRVTLEDGGLVVNVSSEAEPRGEIAAASQKADLLARVLRRKITVRWEGSAAPASSRVES